VMEVAFRSDYYLQASQPDRRRRPRRKLLPLAKVGYSG